MESFRTTFDPSIDGFAFANRFSWTEEEREQVRDLLVDVLQGAPDDASRWSWPVPLPDPVLAADERAPLPGVLENELLLEAAQDLADEFAEAVLRDGGGALGLSGGMTVTALDYRTVNWVLPRGNRPDDQPTRESESGRALRNYLWGRLVAGIELNAATLLEYAVALRLPGDGGTEWLRDHTREHWQHVTSAMPVVGDPIPLTLIGNNTSPLCHQNVLVVGFDDAGDDTGSLHVYDPNVPDDLARVDFDLRGRTVTTTRDDPLTTMRDRGLLRGFFVEAYNPTRPPATLAASLRCDPVCAVAGAPVHFECEVVNRGYHTSPEFAVVIQGDGGAVELREPAFKALDENTDRSFDTTGAFTEPGSHSAVANAVLLTTDGGEVHRELAPIEPGSAPHATIRSNPRVVIELAHDCVSRAVPAGRRITCVVRSSSLAWIPPGVQPVYEWEAAGQTGTGETFQLTVPEDGQPFEVHCTVRAGECWSSGSVTFTPLPAGEADRVIALCEFLDELGFDRVLTPAAMVPLADSVAGAARRFLSGLETHEPKR